MRNKIFIVVGVVIALGLIWFKLSSNQEKANKEIQAERETIPFAAEAVIVKEIQYSSEASYPGMFEVSGNVNVASETEGRVVQANIKNGSSVRKGQVLAIVDNQNKTSAHQINQINFSKAKVDYQRYSELYKQKNATGIELENARHSMQTAEKQMKLSQSELRKNTVVSPISGVVIKKSTNVGDYLSVGSPVALIVPLSQLEVRFNVPEREIPNVKRGQLVTFTVDAYPSRKFEGQILSIIPTANQAKAFPVLIKVNNNQNGITLMGGMSVNVEVKSNNSNNVLVVPRTAVRGDFKAPFVWVVGNDKKATRRSIQIGRELENNVEIVSGIKLGDVVVTKGQSNITEGIVLTSLKVKDLNNTTK